MKCKQCLVLFISLILKISIILTLEKTANESLMEKVDDILVDDLQKKVFKNDSEDDITDSIKNLLNSDLDKPEKINIKENKAVPVNSNKEIDKLKNMHFLQLESNSANSNSVPVNSQPYIENANLSQKVFNNNFNTVNMPVPNQNEAFYFDNKTNFQVQQMNNNIGQNQNVPQVSNNQQMNQMLNYNTNLNPNTNMNVNQNNFNNNSNNMNMFPNDIMMAGNANPNNYFQNNNYINNNNNNDYNNNLNQNNKNYNNLNSNNDSNNINNQNQPKTEELDIIFDHVFINQDGQKYIPNTNNQVYFDSNLGDFVLPEEIIKEDNVTKMLRIKAILDSMDFDSEEISNKIKITDPPIIKGIEKIIPQMNKRENTSSEKIDTKIIKHDFENTYFLQKNDLNKKIRQPPNFMI